MIIMNNKMRNKLCVCGSGKKFKKCCINNIHKNINGLVRKTEENEKQGLITLSPKIFPKGHEVFDEIVYGLEGRHNDDYSDMEQVMVGMSMNELLSKNLDGIDDEYFKSVLKHTFNEVVKNNPSKQVPTLCVLMVNNVCIYRLPLYPQPTIES